MSKYHQRSSVTKTYFFFEVNKRFDQSAASADTLFMAAVTKLLDNMVNFLLEHQGSNSVDIQGIGIISDTEKGLWRHSHVDCS